MPSDQTRLLGAAPFRALLGGGLLALAWLPSADASPADDLPDQLMKASRLIPVTEEGRERCAPLNGLDNLLRIPFSFGDHRTFANGGAGYGPDTKGAYLGDQPKGQPAPPFVQALLDAGAAKRVRLTWVERTTMPTGAIPHLQDTGAPVGSGNEKPAFVTRETTLEGDAFLVTGKDRKLFVATTDRYAQAPLAPAIGGDAGPNDGPGAGQLAPPPGVWSTAKICVVYVPDRILEYGDVQARPNGVKVVSAAILFHPERLPSWASDLRVAPVTRTVFVPDDVRFVTFRDDGDGWRPTPYPEAFIRGKTHIVGGE